MAQPVVFTFPEILLTCCVLICPEFFLPLSVWLTGGWNGLLLHWRAGLCTACRMGRERRGGWR